MTLVNALVAALIVILEDLLLLSLSRQPHVRGVPHGKMTVINSGAGGREEGLFSVCAGCQSRTFVGHMDRSRP